MSRICPANDSNNVQGDRSTIQEIAERNMKGEMNYWEAALVVLFEAAPEERVLHLDDIVLRLVERRLCPLGGKTPAKTIRNSMDRSSHGFIEFIGRNLFKIRDKDKTSAKIQELKKSFASKFENLPAQLTENQLAKPAGAPTAKNSDFADIGIEERTSECIVPSMSGPPTRTLETARRRLEINATCVYAIKHSERRNRRIHGGPRLG
ncbi:MAG TPA: hypothetical protein VGM05_06835 [Planctomycetaceae bacterium]